MWRKNLESRIDALGEEPTHAQQQSLTSWIVSNVPKFYWLEAMDMCSGIGDVYTEISMRDAECGNWIHRQ